MNVSQVVDLRTATAGLVRVSQYRLTDATALRHDRVPERAGDLARSQGVSAVPAKAYVPDLGQHLTFAEHGGAVQAKGFGKLQDRLWLLGGDVNNARRPTNILGHAVCPLSLAD